MLWTKYGILSKILFPIVTAFIVGGSILVFYILKSTAGNAESQAIANAINLLNQYNTLRSYYTENVVAKVTADSRLKVSFDHVGKVDTIPLPATMILDLSDRFALGKQSLIRLRLYSSLPFPVRKDRKLDTFAQSAIAAIQAEPNRVYEQIEDAGFIRVAIADKLNQPACVTCHNTHPLSPKKTWKLGDVRGVLEVTADINEPLRQSKLLGMKISGILIGILLCLLSLLFMRVKHMQGRLQSVSGALDEMAAGNLESRIAVAEKDEIGLLAVSFNEMTDKIQNFTKNLEGMVAERTQKLNETLGEVRALKTQQDADYFLTSQLIIPLTMNHVRSELVHVDFLVKQKKEFEFRNHHLDIGGDICCAHTIMLRDRPFIAFMIGDAMGKSIQGAGGALVMGSVFESIIERTKIVSSVYELFPERWLKNSFIELHKVFESFNGAMMASAIIGLVDEVTGLLYFTNAEQPLPVIYRSGKAVFMEQELLFRKLGWVGAKAEFQIGTFQLLPRDVLIFGSDGRDDFILEGNASGGRRINEDEKLFLGLVEKAEGQLPGIYHGLRNSGELLDDLSLLRICYRPDGAPARPTLSDEARALLVAYKEMRPQDDYMQLTEKMVNLSVEDLMHPSVQKAMIRAFIRAKLYSDAADIGLDYVHKFPADVDFLYYTAYCLRRAGNARLAVDFGERVLLRRPQDVRNLLNLAQAHRMLDNRERVVALLNRVLEKDPSHKRARALLAEVDYRGSFGKDS